jgi:TrpR-related protein YerC/YecD
MNNNQRLKSDVTSVSKQYAAKDKVYPLEAAFLTLSKPDDVMRFLSDLCTPAEIAAFRERWLIAQMLEKKGSYRDIHDQTGASTTTVTRVARFLQLERHRGYRLVLDRLRDSKSA